MAAVGRFLQDPGASYFLFGPRGTGKSTWLKEQYPGAAVVDFLDPETQRRFLARPERLRDVVAALPEPGVVVIDEIQRAPAVLGVVHQLMEQRKSLRFVLTGSSSRKLKREGVDLLGGRALLRSMHPFLAAELGLRFSLEQALAIGLVPLVWDAERPADTLRSYVSLYVREEVQQEGLVRRIEGFTRFLEATSFSHGAVLNTSDIARDAEVSRKTVEGYLQVLEDLLLAFRVPVFTKRARRLLVAHPKLFWFDAGVLRSVRPTGPLDRSEEIGGAALEGLVAQHLRAWIDYSEPGERLFYWRTKSGVEVDFVVYGPGGIRAVEVKHASSVRAADLASLKSFREDYPTAEARLLYRGEETLEIDGIRCVPCGRYLTQVIPGQPLP